MESLISALLANTNRQIRITSPFIHEGEDEMALTVGFTRFCSKTVAGQNLSSRHTDVAMASHAFVFCQFIPKALWKYLLVT